ncbi:class I SAM-dependent methyltransferase [Yersinia enterocolitica]|uniref:class I SAM-dependent methyltransferase n=1 Tax=Yersinia enterocolitica TaxID=630 RepID=UPI003D035684
MEYNKDYYASNAQDIDRPALGFYTRIWQRYCQKGPVLEFGCGVGYFARRLSKITTVYGLEINPHAIEKIKINAPSVQLVPDLDHVKTGSIASIVSLHVLEHIPDAELRDIGISFSRVLSPGGRLLIVVPDKTGKANLIKGDTWMGFRDPTHINLKGNEAWSRWFREEWGFSVVACHADGYYDYPYQSTIWGRFTKDGSRLIRTGIQFLLGRLILPAGDGEAAIFILEKK